MNKDKLKKSVGSWVQLVPSAIELDQHGRPLPTKDDDWFVQSVSADGVVISNGRTRHAPTLGEDSVHHWASNLTRPQNGARYGFYVLTVQLYIQGDEVRVRPTRPGEPLPVQLPNIVAKVVALDYPRASGLQARLNAAGYALGWARPDRVTGLIDIEGYEEVIASDRQGRLAKFRARDGLVLLKRRSSK
jgi:hypothetical protein